MDDIEVQAMITYQLDPLSIDHEGNSVIKYEKLFLLFHIIVYILWKSITKSSSNLT